MLQIAYLRDNKNEVIKRLEKRFYANAEQEVSQSIAFDNERKSIQLELDNILRESNETAKIIGQLMKDGKKDDAELKKSRTAELKLKSKELEEKLIDVEKQLQDTIIKLPNLPHESVPTGRTPEENEIVFQVDKLPELPETAIPHWDLIKKYDIIDFELGNKISGAGFPVYKGKGAKIQRALINFFLDEADKAGYYEVQPPILVNAESGYGTGQLPDKDGQMYFINEDNLYLIPTAEVPITNLYRDVILKQEELPVKVCGYTPCFRREAGSWGAHVRGLNRLHQFDKIEIVRIEMAENSYSALIEMRNHIQGLIEKLDLPFRILRLCGGDMGFTSALTYDFEVYSAAQKRWLEVSSVSNFETFQANRLKLRYKDKEGKNQLLHTLNGSALALPRILASILENNQEEGKIRIPECLWKYTGFESI